MLALHVKKEEHKPRDVGSLQKLEKLRREKKFSHRAPRKTNEQTKTKNKTEPC